MKKLGLRGKLVLFFLVMTLLLLGGIGFSTYKLNRVQVETQYLNMAASVADMATSIIPAAHVEGYLANGADEEYRQVYARLQELKQSVALQFLYVAVPVEGENDFLYVFDVALEGEDTSLIGELGQHTGPVDVYDTVNHLYHAGTPDDVITEVTMSEYGYLASAYMPLVGEDGVPAAVVGVDIPMQQILTDVAINTMQIMGITVAIILLFVMVLLAAVNHAVIRPIRGLSAHMESFAHDEDAQMAEFHLNTGDELEAMAGSFNQMTADIKRYTENLAIITAEHQRVETELNVATQIQTSMLPTTFPPFPNHTEFDLYASMVPAKEVGGDFYDFFMIDDDHLGVVIADVSGKGVPAALFMVISKLLIKDQAAQVMDPAQVLMQVNDKLCANNEAGYFVTVFFGVLEISTGRFVYANAGHNPPLLSQNGDFNYMQVRRSLVLAGMEGYVYKTEETMLHPGDRLLLYTDGVTEAMNPQQELYGEERLHAMLAREGAARLSAREIVELVNHQVQLYAQEEVQADDITVLALVYEKREPSA